MSNSKMTKSGNQMEYKIKIDCIFFHYAAHKSELQTHGTSLILIMHFPSLPKVTVSLAPSSYSFT